MKPLKNVFLLFTGPGSFKKNLKSAYPLIPLPYPGHFTAPLIPIRKFITEFLITTANPRNVKSIMPNNENAAEYHCKKRLVTSRLGAEKSLTFFYSVPFL
jgi:hypothetical protein